MQGLYLDKNKLMTIKLNLFSYTFLKGREFDKVVDLTEQQKLVFLNHVIHDKTIRAGRMKVFYTNWFK